MGTDPLALRLGYVGVFLLAATGCAVGAIRARRVDHPDTRRGLVGLLALSSAWALIQGIRLLAPTTALKIGMHLLGLVIGLSTVGAWLYFCSAYTGKSYHRNGTYRRLAVGIFLSIIAIKLTNPLHGQYMTIRSVSEPFQEIIMVPSALHWTVAGLSYLLAGIGFYMLFELFEETQYDTTKLTVLVSLAGLPALGTTIGYADIGPLLQMDYEPVGVAIFAVGTLYFAEDTFQAVHRHGRLEVLEELDEAILLFDAGYHLRDYNNAASELFPEVSSAAQGTKLKELLPEVAAVIDDSERILDRTIDDQTRHFAVNDESLTLGPHEFGRAIICTDVTELERQRRELTRREDQIEDFTEALTHELRNAVTIVHGQLDLAGSSLDESSPAAIKEQFETAKTTTDRMMRVINDLATLAQHGGLVNETVPCDIRTTVTDAQHDADASTLSVTVDREATVEADRLRLTKLFTQAFKFASANGASEVRVCPTENGFIVEDNGDPMPSNATGDLFEYGTAVPDAKSGGILPPIRTLAQVHGWTVTADTEYRDGIRYQIADAAVDIAEPPSHD